MGNGGGSERSAVGKLDGKTEKAPRPEKVRSFTRKKFAEAAPDILRQLVIKAKEGSVSHTKFLVELGGFERKPMAAPEPKRKGKSFVRRLFDEVEEFERHQAVQTAERQAAEAAADLAIMELARAYEAPKEVMTGVVEGV